MMLDRDEYIFGLPLDTEYGKIRFLKYIEFTKHKVETYLFNQNVLHIYHMYKKENDPKKIQIAESIKDKKLNEIVCMMPELAQSYITIFSLVLDTNDYSTKDLEDIITEILLDENKFNKYRKLVQEMNLLTEDEVSEHDITQMYIELARKAKSENGKPNSILNIVTSLVLSSSHTFEEIAYMTVIQVNALFFKLSQFKNYDTNVLFATVSGNTKFESWAEIPDLFKSESLTISGKEFSSKYGGVTN